MPGGANEFLGGETVHQLVVWGVLFQLITPIMGPLVNEIEQAINEQFPTVRLSPAEVATAVNRGFVNFDSAVATAAAGGVGRNDFQILVDMAGEAPGPQQLAEALRRGIINENAPKDGIPSFRDGIRQGNLRDVWTPLMRQLAMQILTPADAATAVLRGVIPYTEGQQKALEGGLDADNFKILHDLAGEPPALQEVLQWWRRGILQFDGVGPGKTTVANAIATGRIYTYWTDIIKQAQFAPPSAADAVAAVLRGQISKEEGVALAYMAGLGVKSLSVPGGADTTDTENAFEVLLNTSGNPPSLSELIELMRRGIIPEGDVNAGIGAGSPSEISFAQGIREGNNKDKWLPIYAKLAEYVPPPRTVTAVYKAGGYTEAQAIALFEANGLTQADAQAYIAGAQGEKIADSVQLGLSAIETLYYDLALTAQEAIPLIERLGYSQSSAQAILSIQDLKRATTALNSAVGRIGSLFIGHKIDATRARNALGTLKIPGAQIDQLIQTWTLEAGANVKLLTESQIVDAWEYNVLTQDQAQSELEGLGYQPIDAWTLLSNKNKAPLPNKPAAPANPFYTPPPPPPAG